MTQIKGKGAPKFVPCESTRVKAGAVESVLGYFEGSRTPVVSVCFDGGRPVMKGLAFWKALYQHREHLEVALFGDNGVIAAENKALNEAAEKQNAEIKATWEGMKALPEAQRIKALMALYPEDAIKAALTVKA